MARLITLAGLLTSAATCAPSASLAATCNEELDESSMLQQITHVDESSMLQQIVSHVIISADATSTRVTSVHEVLADTRRLADAIKESDANVANITLAAKEYAVTLETELLPSITLALGEMQKALATQVALQRHAAQQCDTRMQGSGARQAGLLSSFNYLKAQVVACDAGVEQVSLKAAQQAKESKAYADLEASRDAKAAECDKMRASTGEAACARASYIHETCAAYGTCRAGVAIANEEATQSVESQAHDHRTQLLEATQAQCIARVLVTSAGHPENMQKRLDECDQLSPSSADENGPDNEGSDTAAMPPMLVCEDVIVHSCADGLVELDVGASGTWSAPCQACPAMVQAEAAAPERHLGSTLKSWLTTAVEGATGTFNFGYRHSPTLNLVHLYDQSDNTASSTSTLKSWLYGQYAATSSSTSSLKAMVFGKSDATSSDSHAGQYVALLVAVPLVSMGVALCVAVALNGPSSRHGNDASDGKHAPLMGRRNSGSMRSLGAKGHELDHSYGHGGPKMPSPQHSFGHGQGSPGGSQRNSLESMERPSIGSNRGVGSSRALYSRQDLPPRVNSSGGQSQQEGPGLCPELMVPEGSECILAIPSLASAAPGEVTLKNITDKTGEALLYVGITSAPKGGEYVLLAKKDQQELAFCELGAAMRAEGWSGKIFRWDGEIYARLREERPSEGMARNSMGPTAGVPMGGSSRSFLLIAAGEPYWELRVTGSLQDRKMSVEDGSRQVVAMVSPGEELASGRPSKEFYKLRLGPNADSCTVIVALLAIERLLSQQAHEQGVARSDSRSDSRGCGSI